MKVELETIHHRVSQRLHTDLDLQEGEFVELKLQRSRIGTIIIWSLVGLTFVLLTVAIVFLWIHEHNGLNDTSFNKSVRICLLIGLLLLYVVAVVAGVIASSVYKRNIMYITNRRVIQKVVTSPFAHSKNIIELSSIEDASYSQKGIVPHLLHFGTLRLATVGDETTYTFPYLDTPTDELDTISRLVHNARKNAEKN